ncbi:MAG: O-methyltransferase [Lachnospiraceae bacterium]
MVVDERTAAYLHSLDVPDSAFLEALKVEARQTHVPIIRREMQNFLKVMLAIKKPERILEVGTAIGFSTLLMCEYTQECTKIDTIELNDRRFERATANVQQAHMGHRIRLLKGDAAEVLPTLTGSYDFIFMDAAKGQYMKILPDILRLLEIDGVLLSDNVLQEGDIVESRFIVERRNRTIHKRMREYLYTLTHHELLRTSIIPLGDGITVSSRIRTAFDLQDGR